MTLLFVGMTSGEMVFAGLDPLLSKSGTCPDSNKGIFTALSAAGRRNGRWSACLVPRLIVESWQGVSIEPLKPRSLSSKLGVNKTMSPLGRPGPRSDPLLGRSSQTNSVPLHPSSSFHASAAAAASNPYYKKHISSCYCAFQPGPGLPKNSKQPKN